jgi:quercetin dioxygenase-like cupin family protein
METTSTVRLRRGQDVAVEEHPWGHLTWMVSGQLGNSEELTVGTCHVAPRQHNPRHHHPNCDEVLHVLSGRIVHTLGEEEFEMWPGDTISIARGVQHNAHNVGEDTAVLMIAFSTPDRQVVVEAEEAWR